MLILKISYFKKEKRLVGTWIRREVVDGARRIKSEKLKEHQYREYARSLEGKKSRMRWRK